MKNLNLVIHASVNSGQGTRFKMTLRAQFMSYTLVHKCASFLNYGQSYNHFCDSNEGLLQNIQNLKMMKSLKLNIKFHIYYPLNKPNFLSSIRIRNGCDIFAPKWF